MRSIPGTVLAIVVVGVFVIGIAVAMATDLWITESRKVPATFATGEFAGEYDPGDIRGSYTFADVENAFGVPARLLARAFGIVDAADPGAIAAKELEERYGAQPDGGDVGTDSLRLFVSLYTGLPYEPEDSTRLPSSALRELATRLAPADIETVRQIVIPQGGLVPAGTAASSGDAAPAGSVPESAQAQSTEHTDDEMVVKGKTTFGELLDWGLTKEQIEEALGTAMGPRTATVRDHVTQAGLEFSEARAALDGLLESLQAGVQE